MEARGSQRHHGVAFDRLFTLTNMPISRFLEWLDRARQLEAYMERLVAAFNPAAVAGLMCRNTLSVGWDGTLYDCDFNQMLELPVGARRRRPHVRDFDPARLAGARIVTGRHCFGCTAGAGQLLRRRHDVSQPPRLSPATTTTARSGRERTPARLAEPGAGGAVQPRRRRRGTAGLVAAAGAAASGRGSPWSSEH